MNKLIIALCFLVFFEASAYANDLLSTQITFNENKKMDLTLFKDSVLYTEENDLTYYLKLYDIYTISNNLIATSKVPFENIYFNDKYIVWAARSNSNVDDKINWQIWIYDRLAKKQSQLTNGSYINKYPMIWKDNVVYYETKQDGSVNNLVKININTRHKETLISNQHIFNPMVSNNLLLFTSNSSSFVYVLNLETAKMFEKIQSRIVLNDAAFTGHGVIWSSSSQQYSTSSQLYEYIFNKKNIVPVIPELSWGKGRNFISPRRWGNLVFYLSGDQYNGFDLWQHDLITDKQVTLSTNVFKFFATQDLVVYIKDNNLHYMKFSNKEFIPGNMEKSSLPASDSVKKPKPASTKDYADVTGHWAETSIKKLIKLGIITGDKNNQDILAFRPNDKISRAEFSTILALTLKIKVMRATTPVFDDIKGHWSEPFVTALYNKGAVIGTSNSKFQPHESITRAEAVTTIARGKDWYSSKRVNFSDVPPSHWAHNYISALFYRKVIFGSKDSNFNPEENLSRGEAAVLMDRIIAK